MFKINNSASVLLLIWVFTLHYKIIQLLAMEIAPLSPQEIQQLRTETKGTAERIHFNNAGSSLPPDVVVDTVISYLQEEATHGGYETEDKYEKEMEHTYDLIAKLINANRDEVAVMENASIAWGLVFNGIVFTEGDEVITSEMEYLSNLMGFITAQKTHGVKIIVIPTDEVERSFKILGELIRKME
jgi:cysteine desulfurase / selenocysteine lyase